MASQSGVHRGNLRDIGGNLSHISASNVNCGGFGTERHGFGMKDNGVWSAHPVSSTKKVTSATPENFHAVLSLSLSPLPSSTPTPTSHHTNMPSEEAKVRQVSFLRLSYSTNLWLRSASTKLSKLDACVFLLVTCKFSTLTDRVHVRCQQTVIHYGWIPFIIYVGYTRSNPQPELFKCVYLMTFRCSTY